MDSQTTIQMMNAMKLAGMAQAYQAIAALPANKQPSTHDCIATIIDAEKQHRALKRTDMYLRLSKIKYRAHIKDIIYNDQRNLDKNVIAALADCSYINRAHNIIVTGATGCGKSYLVSALGHQACIMGYRTLYFNMNRLCEEIALAKMDGSFIKWINRLKRANLIILDDFGLQPLTQQVKLALLQVLEDRYGQAATIISAQLPHQKWYDYFDDPTLADAILDRITADCTKIGTGQGKLSNSKL